MALCASGAAAQPAGSLAGRTEAPVRYGPPPPVLADIALPNEIGMLAGDRVFGVLVTAPLVRRRLSATGAAGFSGTATLGLGRAAAGLFASAGTAGNLLVASAGAGVWAETSPRGRAFGPAVEARLRLAVLRAEAGAVVAGTRARWLRVGVGLPLLVVVAGGIAFVGVAVETRRFDATGRTLRTVAVSLSL